MPPCGDRFEDDSCAISSAVRHLLELFNPDEETRDRKRAAKAQGKGKWTFASLPALPPRFALRPIKKNMDRLSHLAKLAKRADLGGVVNACDAGREGELIFHNLAEEFSFDSRSLPVERLWLQSMTPAAFRTAFQGLVPATLTAVTRSLADWLVGINSTSALSAFNSKDGAFQLTTARRVQTPTLTLLVESERQQHVPVPFWLVDEKFHIAAGGYAARWKLSAADGDGPARVTELAQAAAGVSAVLDDHKYTGITVKAKPKGSSSAFRHCSPTTNSSASPIASLTFRRANKASNRVRVAKRCWSIHDIGSGRFTTFDELDAAKEVAFVPVVFLKIGMQGT